MDAKRGGIRCKGLTKVGKPCRAASTAGGLCFFHANPNKASELGRKGGRGNRHAGAPGMDPLPRLDTAIAVHNALEQITAGVYSGQIKPQIASTLARLLGLVQRAIETVDHERRFAEMEKLLAELKESLAATGSAHNPSLGSKDLAACEAMKA
jgi:general stress protein YciG